MKRKILPTWLLIYFGIIWTGILALAFIVGFLASPWIEVYLARYTKPIPPFGEAWLLLEQGFYGNLPSDQERLYGAIHGILATLDDPYTVLIEPQPAQQERQRLSGSYGDIGVTLWWDLVGEIRLSPYPEGPAAQAGIQSGDRLLEIEGEPVKGMTLDAVRERLQGDIGTPVALTLQRTPEAKPAVILTILIEREEVLRPSVEWRFLDAERGIGYLDINLFTDQTADEVRKALTSLQGSTPELQALVMDLRGNGGGVIAPLPQIAGLFLPSGTVIYVEDAASGEQPITAAGEPYYTGGDLVVLVDGNTASAAEILAAALSENDVAVLMGEPTFGKGSIQALYPLKDGSTLHVTSAVWLTAEHNRLDGIGLQPDYYVENQAGQDATLDAALNYLRR